MVGTYDRYYEAYDALENEKQQAMLDKMRPRNAFQAFKERNKRGVKMDGFKRMEACRHVRAIKSLS